MKKTAIIIIVIVVLIILLSFGAYYIYVSKKEENEKVAKKALDKSSESLVKDNLVAEKIDEKVDPVITTGHFEEEKEEEVIVHHNQIPIIPEPVVVAPVVVDPIRSQILVNNPVPTTTTPSNTNSILPNGTTTPAASNIDPIKLKDGISSITATVGKYKYERFQLENFLRLHPNDAAARQRFDILSAEITRLENEQAELRALLDKYNLGLV